MFLNFLQARFRINFINRVLCKKFCFGIGMEEDNQNKLDKGKLDDGKRLRPRKKHLYHMIRQQIEFYLGDINLSKDRFFGSLMQESPYIDIKYFLKCNRIQKLTSKPEDIVKAISKSKLISISEDGTKLYRTEPVQHIENEDDCTIYVEDLPMNVDHEWLKNIFKKYGEVAYISLPRFKNGNKSKGFAFVQFETPEGARRALEVYSKAGSCLSSDMPPTALRSINTYEGDKSIVIAQDPLSMTNIKYVTVESNSGASDTNQDMFKNDIHEPVKNTSNINDEEEPDNNNEESANIEELNVKGIKRQLSNGDKKVKNKEVKYSDVDISGNENSTVECSHAKKSKKIKREKSVVTNITSDVITENVSTTESKMDDVMAENIPNKEDDVVFENVHTKTDKCIVENIPGKKGDAICEYISDRTDDVVAGNLSTENEYISDNVMDANNDGNKKRKRKRTKKKKVEVITYGMQILSKRDWKKLRNKYLDEQKKKAREIKIQLQKMKYQSAEYSYPTNDNYIGDESEENLESGSVDDSSQEPELIPGVIIKLTLHESVSDVKSFKDEVRRYPDVLYVDVEENSSVAYVRCSNLDSAEQFISSGRWPQMKILKGTEEEEYYKKMMKDREEKRNSKKRSKVRGKDKLQKKLDNAYRTHIKFAEWDN